MNENLEVCKHEFEDDGDNLQIVCTKCNIRFDVDFSNSSDIFDEVFEEIGKEDQDVKSET